MDRQACMEADLRGDNPQAREELLMHLGLRNLDSKRLLEALASLVQPSEAFGPEPF